MTDPAIIRRIKGLLALAKSPEKAEAESAMAMAQALLLKYGLDLATLSDQTKTPEVEDSENPLGMDAREAPVDDEGPVAWRCQLAAAVASGCMCRVIRYQDAGRWVLCYVGRKHDIEVAQYMLAYLEREFRERAEAAWKEPDAVERVIDAGRLVRALARGEPPPKRRRRGRKVDYVRDFCTAAVAAVNARLREGRTSFAASSPAASALLRRRDEEVDAVVAEQFPGTTRAAGPGILNSLAKIAGLRVGAAIPLNGGLAAADIVKQALGGKP